MRIRKLCERIEPAEPREAPKVGVIRLQFGLMLDRERRQVEISGQLARDSGRRGERLEQVEVTRARMDCLRV